MLLTQPMSRWAMPFQRELLSHMYFNTLCKHPIWTELHGRQLKHGAVLKHIHSSTTIYIAVPSSATKIWQRHSQVHINTHYRRRCTNIGPKWKWLLASAALHCCEMGTVIADLIKILPKIMCLKKQDRKTAISPCIASNISLRFVLVQMQWQATCMELCLR